MDLSTIRNIGIAAHIDAGKTTVTERILYCSGVEHRVGHVDDGTAVMDFMNEERERGITIAAAATRVPWRGHEFNLIDTPGHVDFTVEVERCMRVLDGAVLVIDAVAGVQAQSETVWRQIKQHSIPSVAFVNKCDRVGTDFFAAVQSLRDRLGIAALPIQLPWFEGDKVVGVVDLIEMRGWRFVNEGGKTGAKVAGDIPDDLRVDAEVMRSEMLDTLGDHDDEIMQAVLEEQEISADAVRLALRAATLRSDLQPVLCGAALRGVGTQPLMDAIVDYLPSPLDRPPVRAWDGAQEQGDARAADPAAPLAALAFKLHGDEHGTQTFVRIYSGTLQVGKQVWNPRVRRMERVARILRMHADSGEALDEAFAGDIVALTGLKLTGTGDTLCTRDDELLLEPPNFPEPVIALIVEPASSEDRDKLRTALTRLAHEDPSLHIHEDAGTGQWRVEGMGELHLEVIVNRLHEEFRLDAHVGKPRVSYREAVLASGVGEARVERALGGKDVFAEVRVEVDAGEEGSTNSIEWAEDVVIPDDGRVAMEEALIGETQSGPKFGFSLVGAVVRVLSVRTRPGFESEQAFAMAGTMALRQALTQAKVALLEPTMRFDIHSPEEFASGIIADLGSRKAEVAEVTAERDSRSVRGSVPLAQMFGYSTVVRSLSQGRASFVMRPAGYQAVSEEEQANRGLVWT
ncbi:MAG: elongation factor G [Planctomycetota bacterium]|jgi:elongation factor G